MIKLDKEKDNTEIEKAEENVVDESKEEVKISSRFKFGNKLKSLNPLKGIKKKSKQVEETKPIEEEERETVENIKEIVDTIETKVDEEATKEEDERTAEADHSKGKKGKREAKKKGKETEASALETVERKRKNAVAKDISQDGDEESEVDKEDWCQEKETMSQFFFRDKTCQQIHPTCAD